MGLPAWVTQASSMAGQAVPAGHGALVLGELSPTPGVEGGKLVRISRSVARIVAGTEWEEGQFSGVAALHGAQVKREELTVQRAHFVDATAAVRTEPAARSVTLSQYHQAPAFAKLHEAPRLAGHVHLVWPEPLDERTGRLGRRAREAS